MISVKAVLLTVIILCLISIIIFGNILNKINIEVVQFYRTLRIWDVN